MRVIAGYADYDSNENVDARDMLALLVAVSILLYMIYLYVKFSRCTAAGLIDTDSFYSATVVGNIIERKLKISTLNLMTNS